MANFYREFFIGNALAFSVSTENAILLTLNKISTGTKNVVWSLSSGGTQVMTGTVPYNGFNDSLCLIGDIVLDYRLSKHFRPGSTLFSSNAQSMKHDATRYSLETIMTGLNVICLLPDYRLAHSESRAKRRHQSVTAQ